MAPLMMFFIPFPPSIIGWPGSAVMPCAGKICGAITYRGVTRCNMLHVFKRSNDFAACRLSLVSPRSLPPSLAVWRLCSSGPMIAYRPTRSEDDLVAPTKFYPLIVVNPAEGRRKLSQV